MLNTWKKYRTSVLADDGCFYSKVIEAPTPEKAEEYARGYFTNTQPAWLEIVSVTIEEAV